MNEMDMLRAIRQELSTTNEDITTDYSSDKARKESDERWSEFRMLVQRIGVLARPIDAGRK